SPLVAGGASTMGPGGGAPSLPQPLAQVTVAKPPAPRMAPSSAPSAVARDPRGAGGAGETRRLRPGAPPGGTLAGRPPRGGIDGVRRLLGRAGPRGGLLVGR